MEQVEHFSMDKIDEAPYNLEVNVVSDLKMLQVFVAGSNTVSIIEQVKDQDGEIFFLAANEVWAGAEE